MAFGGRSKRLVLAFLLCTPCGWAGRGAAEDVGILRQIEDERAGILEENRASVVRIHAIYARAAGDDGQQLGQGFTHGTGFVIDDAGHILTVDEAVRGADEIRVILDSGEQVPGRLVGSDQASEVAVIQVSVEGLQPADLGDSGRIRAGHYAFILGNSFGALSPSFGTTQQVDREQDLIHISAPVQPSYGGAPVFCSSGEVVGMVWAAVDPWSAFRSAVNPQGHRTLTWQELPTTVYVVPINRAVAIARRLTSQARPVYGYLGIQGEAEAGGGVRVIDVAPDGPAAASGIGTDDLILAYNGDRVMSLWHFIYLVMNTSPGSSASLNVSRDGHLRDARVTVGDMDQKIFAEIVAQMRTLPSPIQVRGPASQARAKQMGQRQDALGLTQDPGEMFRQIDRLEQEIRRLRQQILQGGP